MQKGSSWEFLNNLYHGKNNSLKKLRNDYDKHIERFKAIEIYLMEDISSLEKHLSEYEKYKNDKGEG